MRETLVITPRPRGHAIMLKLQGELTYHTRGIFKEAIDKVIQGGCTHVVVDLEHVTFIDSAALGVLALLSMNFKTNHRRLCLLSPQRSARDTLRLAHVSEILPTYENEVEALRTAA